jgi:hypothetical protein
MEYHFSASKGSKFFDFASSTKNFFPLRSEKLGKQLISMREKNHTEGSQEFFFLQIQFRVR